jgi:hypothetical protein
MRLSVFALEALVPPRDLPVSATAIATDGLDRPHLNFDRVQSHIGYSMQDGISRAGCWLSRQKNERY